jgi:hypothetical protein
LVLLEGEAGFRRKKISNLVLGILKYLLLDTQVEILKRQGIYEFEIQERVLGWT